MMPGFSHMDEDGAARMVDVSAKAMSRREAVAVARISLSAEAFAAARDGRLPKGDLLPVARLAGMAAAKRTADLIPLCHPLPLDRIEIRVRAVDDARAFDIEATCSAEARTGVEMEALVAASTAALALYDMVKAVDRQAVIGPVAVVRKSGGRSGDWSRGWPPGAETSR